MEFLPNSKQRKINLIGDSISKLHSLSSCIPLSFNANQIDRSFAGRAIKAQPLHARAYNNGNNLSTMRAFRGNLMNACVWFLQSMGCWCSCARAASRWCRARRAASTTTTAVAHPDTTAMTSTSASRAARMAATPPPPPSPCWRRRSPPRRRRCSTLF